MKRKDPWFSIGGNAATIENRTEVPKEITIIPLRNPTSGYISKGKKIKLLRRYLYFHVHCSIVYQPRSESNIRMIGERKCDACHMFIHTHTHTHTHVFPR